MASIILAMLISSMDTTIMNTTMPVIAKELGRQEWYAWTFASYMIFSTVIAPIAGRLSDMFGRKKVFGAGIILFTLGSMLCGLSGTMIQLVIFRGIQGFGAGFMMPFPAIIAGDLFAIEQRGKIQAFFSAMWGIGSVVAPLLGGFFVEQMTWRWIFYINVPICLISLVLLHAYKEVYAPKKAKVDVTGAILFSAAISLLLLTTVVESGQVWYGVAGVLLLAGFIQFERKVEAPILPLDLLRNPPIAWMIVNSFLACAALFGTSSYIPLYLQQEGYSILWSGIPLVGMSLGWMAVSIKAGKWIVSRGYRPLLLLGNGVSTVSGILLAWLQEGSGLWYVSLAMLLQGVAFGLIVTVSIIGAQQLVGAHRKGISTSLQMFARNIGTAIGVTVMGALLNSAAHFYDGITHVFLYGLIVSILALASAWFIKVSPAAGGSQQQS
ncbi:MFS transporter [Gorillibacterium sp. sgz5001074]|uniref:MFS transporter n=1 Tax=Gorillibacterium sp. sgz5001074 TaxID=3446695 RepID=UPI003F67CE33